MLNLTQLVSSPEWGQEGPLGLLPLNLNHWPPPLLFPLPSASCMGRGPGTKAGFSPGGRLQLGRIEQDASLRGGLPPSAWLGHKRCKACPDLPTGLRGSAGERRKLTDGPVSGRWSCLCAWDAVSFPTPPTPSSAASKPPTGIG